MTTIRVKRVYEAPSAADGFRILVDRLWPRGLSREHAQIDAWLKTISPSNELRRWFNHDPARWDAFKTRYFAELEAEPAAVAELTGLVDHHRTVSLLFGAREEQFNNAHALAEFLEARRRKKD